MWLTTEVRVSDADEFVAAVDANGGGIEEKFCRRIFGSLRHAAMQREAKEKRQREREAKQAGATIRVAKVPSRTMTDVLKEYGHTKIDFYSLDVEDAELSVLRTIDWKQIQVHFPNFSL